MIRAPPKKMKQKYIEIDKEILNIAYGQAWPIECMAAHDAEGRKTNYVGSVTKGEIITDYYRDSKGAWWFENRAVKNGRIISMEEYIFGHAISKKGKRKS